MLSGFRVRRTGSATITMTHYRSYELWSLGAVVLSVAFTIAESMPAVQNAAESNEWLETVFRVVNGTLGLYFVFDYIWRLRCDGCVYACSFFGAVDLLGAAAILPDILALTMRIPMIDRNCGSLLRAIRLLRVFRVLKLSRFVDELHKLQDAVTAETHAVLVFYLCVSIALLFLGSALYVVESGATTDFGSIPHAMWWAIVTLTTVGYGDVVPATFLGRLIACAVMLLGYSILAVPTITSVLGQTSSASSAARNNTNSGLMTPMSQAQGQGGFLRCSSPMPLLAEEEADLLTMPSISMATMEPLATRNVNDSLKDYPFVVHLPTRQSDADEFGYIQSSAFSLFLEAAVSSLLSSAALQPGQFDAGPPSSRAKPRAIAAKTACSVLIPVVLPDSLDAGVSVEEVSLSTCTFAVGLFARSTGRLCALGRLHHVWVDAASRRPVQMPPEVRVACSRAGVVPRPEMTT